MFHVSLFALLSAASLSSSLHVFHMRRGTRSPFPTIPPTNPLFLDSFLSQNSLDSIIVPRSLPSEQGRQISFQTLGTDEHEIRVCKRVGYDDFASILSVAKGTRAESVQRQIERRNAHGIRRTRRSVFVSPPSRTSLRWKVSMVVTRFGLIVNEPFGAPVDEDTTLQRGLGSRTRLPRLVLGPRHVQYGMGRGRNRSKERRVLTGNEF